MVAVPRGVHRSLVNRYGPRTPAVVAKDANGAKAGGAAAAAGASGRISVGRGRGVPGSGLALVGSSRPLLELSSCPACAALGEEMARIKTAEQKEVRVAAAAALGVGCVVDGVS